MAECLSRIRQHGESTEEEFERATADLPQVLRDCADLLEHPPADVGTRHEAPALESYSLWALSYDAEMDNPVVLGEEEVIREAIGKAEGLKVLDVGCGTGRHAVPLAAAGARVVGLDPAPEMLNRARAKAEAAGVELDLRGGGIDSLDDRLGQFDLVLCCLVLSHVEALHDAAARLASRVAAGGRLIVTDFHPTNLLLGFRTAFSHEGQRYIVPNFLHPISEYFDAMRKTGLVVTRIEELGGWEKLPGVPTTLLMEASRTL
ncbi:MAG: methyltransferase domain-containing protein [Armatimonadetes bacterium]|nr:methyltransferase domain-containing protein [Armatimonadota bacterium]